MGQYFKAINTKKEEFVCPWCIGGGAKFYEWAANPQGGIFTLLLHKSSAIVEIDVEEGREIIAERWASDPVYLIGDYDDSPLCEKAKRYKNISEPLVEQCNQILNHELCNLAFDPCGRGS